MYLREIILQYQDKQQIIFHNFTCFLFIKK